MISYAAIDTNFLIDIFIDRDTSKKTLKKLYKAMDEFDVIFVPFHTIVEFIYVLENIRQFDGLERLSKEEIIEKVSAICTTPQFEVENIKVLQLALKLYKTHKIGDSIIAATILNNGIATILSNDKHFTKINGIKVY